MSEYDDVAEPVAAAPEAGSEYDDPASPDLKQAVKGSLYVGAQKEPDRQAKVIELADRMKLPADMVERNYDSYSKASVSETTDYDDLVDKHPGTAQYLSDPANSAVAHDDIDGLRQTEQIVQDMGIASTMGRSLMSGVSSMYANMARVPALAYDAFAIPQNIIAKATGGVQVRSADWARNNSIAKYYDEAADAYKTPAMSRSITQELDQGNYSRAGMALAAQFAANAPQQAAIMLGALSGLGIPTLAGVGAVSAAGANKEAQESGVDPLTASANALSKGTVEAGFESLGTFGILKHWAGALTKQYGKEASKQVLQDFAKTMLHSFAGEANEEAMTSVVHDFTDYVTGTNPDALEGIGQRALDAGLIGGVSGSTMTAPTATIAGLERSAKARDSTLARDFFLSMGKSIEASKLRERLPDAKKKFIEQITQGTPVETIYISAEAVQTYFQSKNIPAAQAMQQMGLSEQYNEAVELGTDVKIPLADFANKLVGTEHYTGLANDIRFDPFQLSVNETKAESERAKQELETQATAATEGAPVNEQTFEDQATEIADQEASQLAATGRVSEHDAKVSTSLTKNSLLVRAERRGLSPREVYDSHPVSIGTGEDASAGEQTLNQSPPSQFDLAKKHASTKPPLSSYPSTKQAEFLRGITVSSKATTELFTLSESETNGTGEYVFASQEQADAAAKESGGKVSKIEVSTKDLYPVGTQGQFFHLKAEHKGTVDYDQSPKMSVSARKRRAKKLGFNTSKVFYHGTKANIAAFDTNALGASTNAGSAKQGFFFASDASTASDYAALAPERRNLEYTRDSERLSELNKKKADGLTPPEWDELAAVEKRLNEAPDEVFEDRKRAIWSIEEEISTLKRNNPEQVKKAKKQWESSIENVQNILSGKKTEQYPRPREYLEHLLDKYTGYLKEAKLSLKPAAIKKDKERLAELEAKLSLLSQELALGDTLGANVIPVYLKLSNPYVHDYEGAEYRDEKYADIMAKAKELGHDSVIFENTFDPGDPNNRVEQDIVAVFSPEQIRSVNASFIDGDSTDILAQSGADDAQGRIRFGTDKTFIDILKGANLSTFLHESGHRWLNEMGQDVEFVRALDPSALTHAQKVFLTDADKMLAWLGAESFETLTVEQHEKMARGTEAYLREGKAPSKELRSAFASFRVWLTQIYRKLAELNVELTDEVRGVFDRIIATEEQIEVARQEMRIEPLVVDPKAMGMSDEMAYKYLNAVQHAKDHSKDELSRKLMAPLIRAKEKFWQDKRVVIRDEVEKEVSQQQIYVAIDKLQTGADVGGVPFKLSRDSVNAEYGKDVAKQLPKKTVSKKGEGIHPDIVAESLGFTSGSDLISQLTTAQDKDAVIDAETDRRMEDLFPDLLKDPKLPQVALEAVHNDANATRLRIELEYLVQHDLPVVKDAIRRVGRRVPSEKAVREQAQKVIGSRIVKELSPHLFQRAEIRAAKEAGLLLAKGDIEGAFAAKRRELMNHELYRAAVEAKETVETGVAKFKKMTKKADEDVAKSRDMDLVNAARSILAAVGIGKSEKPASAYIEAIRKYDPDTFETVQALISTVDGIDMEYRQLKFDDFVALQDTVQALWDLSRTNRQMVIDGKIMNRDEIKEELSTRLGEITSGAQRAGYDKAATTWDRAAMGLMGIRASLRRVESWVDAVDGGNRDGAFRKYIWNPISDATTKYREVKRGYLQKYLAIVERVESSLTAKPIHADELGYQFANKSELLAALLHTGNESNLSKLLRGRGWGELDADGNLDRSRWDKFFARIQRDGTLTMADMNYVQAVWDLNEELKPDAQRAHKQMYGHYFNEVTANEFVALGQKFRGGYVPAVTDPFLAQDAAIRSEKEALEKSNNSFMFPTAGRGFTKSRVDQYAAPLALDLRYVPSHIDKVLRFIHIEPTVKDVGRLVMDKSFRKVLDAFDPTVGGDMLVPWLQRAAQQKIVMSSQGWGGRATDTFFRELRTRTGFNVMVGNVVNALQQVTGLSMAAVQVPPANLRNSLWTYTRSPKKTTEVVSDKSAFMRTRVTAQVMEVQQTIDEMLLNPTKYEEAREFAKKHGYFLQSGAQNIVDIITWTGAYDHAVAGGATEIEAVRAADSIVRETQGSFNAEDISRFETGTPFVRAFTMFYSYFNMQANLLGSEFTKTVRDLGLKKGAGRLLYVYAMGFMIPAVLSQVIIKALSGGSGDDDDDDALTQGMSVFFGSQFRSLTAMVPVLGMSINSGINAFNSKWYDDGITASPAISMIESAVTAPASVYKAITDDGSKKKAVRDTLSLLGLMTGLPLAPLGKPAGYALDVMEGKANPSGPIDMARGLVTGKPGKQ